MCVVQKAMEGFLVGGEERGGGKERVGLWVCSRGRGRIGDLGDIAGEQFDVIGVLGDQLFHTLGSDEVDLYRRGGKGRTLKEEGRGDSVGRPINLWIDL